MNGNIVTNVANTKITYVVAKYSKLHNVWRHQYDSEEIEKAKEKLNELREYHPDNQYGILEYIQSETYTLIDDSSI